MKHPTLVLGVVAAAVAVAALPLAAAYPSTIYGIDVSSPVSRSQFDCLKGDGLTFAVVRCWHSYGAPDSAAPATLKAAHDAGVDHDVYMFPCPKCGDGAGQVSKAVSYLKDNGAPFSRFWFDIEGPQYWLDQDANRRFFESMLSEAKNLGLDVGIYTSASQWDPIMGDYSGGSAHPLWYADYDGIPSFSDFRAFGGWSKPYAKQFSDKGAKCGASYDINWRPPH